KAVGVGPQWAALRGVSKHPLLGEPGEVADLPERRVDGSQPGAEKPVVAQDANEVERPPAGVGDPVRESGGADPRLWLNGVHPRIFRRRVGSVNGRGRALRPGSNRFRPSSPCAPPVKSKRRKSW